MAAFESLLSLSTAVDSSTDLSVLVDLRKMRERLDAAITEQVARARQPRLRWRQHGYSWARIGEALGTTGQAAQQKFGRSA